VAATTYVMGQMIENYNQNKAFVDSFEWYFLPVANPDGYAYTHTQA
jgi:murein tripeptide amidase MpaA